MTRAEFRRERKALNKASEQAAKERARQNGRRALLRRQSEREKSGFYEGSRPVGQCIAKSKSRVNSTKNPLKITKGKAFGRILRVFTGPIGREIQIHATKGARSYRASA